MHNERISVPEVLFRPVDAGSWLGVVCGSCHLPLTLVDQGFINVESWN